MILIAFSFLIKKVKLKYGHSLKVATYLQLPVLHLTKYHLLLDRFLKTIDKESSQHLYKKTQEALELMKFVNDQINRDMPEFTPNEKTCNNFNNKSDFSEIEQIVKSFGPIIKQV